MRRFLLTFPLLLLMAGCAGTGPVDEAPPEFRYSFVVDGRLARTLSVPAGMDRISVVFQPRSGESAIWQIYEASYAHVVLEPDEGDLTARGGRALSLEGTVDFYRDLKMSQADGQDEVVRGKPFDSVDVEASVTVEPGAPAILKLAEGLHVEIALLPKPPSP